MADKIRAGAAEASRPPPTDYQVSGDHYKNKAIQPITYIMANDMDFCEGNVVKYVTRWKNKGGVDDLRKAAHYIEFLIAQEVEGK